MDGSSGTADARWRCKQGRCQVGDGPMGGRIWDAFGELNVRQKLNGAFQEDRSGEMNQGIRYGHDVAAQPRR